MHRGKEQCIEGSAFSNASDIHSKSQSVLLVCVCGGGGYT